MTAVCISLLEFQWPRQWNKAVAADAKYGQSSAGKKARKDKRSRVDALLHNFLPFPRSTSPSAQIRRNNREACLMVFLGASLWGNHGQLYLLTPPLEKLIKSIRYHVHAIGQYA